MPEATGAAEVREGDALELLTAMETASVDAIVCDPPYGIGFMGHDWDRPGDHGPVSAGHGGCNGSFGGAPHPAMEVGRYDLSATANQRFQRWCEAWARECLRVLKPGGHMLVFGGTRTYHRMAAGIEDAGFEIRDTLMWMFGSGFPKSLNVSRAIDGAADSRDLYDVTAPATAAAMEGWGTALKPAWEPIVLARKPLDGTVAANVLAYGTGALNIDECRIGTEATLRNRTADDFGMVNDDGWTPTPGVNGSSAGRWPANVLLDPDAAALLDARSGDVKGASSNGKTAGSGFGAGFGPMAQAPSYGDTGGASRFFYCAKTSRGERDAGLDSFEPKALNWSSGDENPGASQSDGTIKAARNHHPTVKPIELMRWLVRLVTPAEGLVLDPFVGSGSTGCAAALEGFRFVGIEREPDYVTIARKRIAWWVEHPEGVQPAERIAAERAEADRRASGQMGLLD